MPNKTLQRNTASLEALCREKIITDTADEVG